jgi:uncharacterized membrane protein
MSLAPLLNAASAIPVHGLRREGHVRARRGPICRSEGNVASSHPGQDLVSVAVSSFWIHRIRLAGPWSVIHLLSIFTLVTVPLGVWRAHRHRVADHRRVMRLVFSGALGIAGLFTLLPGRIMHAVVFGQ